MIKTLTILFFLAPITFNCFGQLSDTKIRQEVLALNVQDSVCIYGKWTENGETETHLKYLGSVTTTDGRVFKIMNSICLWGYAKHATSRILIFNEKNQYVGNYMMYMVNDLPEKLENGKLIFRNNDTQDCDKKLTTRIDLTHGLPKQFFIACKDPLGDMYIFSSN